MKILKYNFRKFFEGENICIRSNNDYITNSHFLLNKKILKKSHSNFLLKLKTQNLTNDWVEIYLKPILNRKTKIKFTPDFIVKSTEESQNFYIMNYNNKEYMVKEEHYNFIQDIKCNIYITEKASKTDPFIVLDQNNKKVGLVLPVFLYNSNLVKNKIDYENYIKDLELKALKEKEEKKNDVFVKVCFFDGVRNKTLKFLKEIQGMKFYYLKNQLEDYQDAYTNINGFMCPVCNIGNIENLVKKIKSENIDLYQCLKKTVDNCLNSGNNICSLGLAEMVGRLEEAKEHNQKVREQRQEKELERKRELAEEKAKEAEEKALAEKLLIEETEKTFINGGTIKDGDIIVKLADKYNVNIPLRTKGWILNNLAEATITESGSVNYRYWKRTKNATGSQKVYDVLFDIRSAIKKEKDKITI